MVAVNKSFQSGHARAYIEHTPFDRDNVMYVRLEPDVWVTFEKAGILTHTGPGEGIKVDRELACFAWTDQFEDVIVDVFKAIGKALEIYSDEPSQAYKQGYAEGEAKVLREWKEELRGILGETAQALLKPEYQ